ncbi:DUF2922 domain-containing protein [Lactobacillus sp. LL6]|uniref:DUF2922 domain-containing protein n=1 Tax=Lactobacillus sp. LL6 TaxID=2596827 RepID=UPI0011865EB2|nr:DUF2922 domain-containing protein [Lactobacillus sp. LL6]TSO26855.1 DUF2922 domain-containing protein [Lactobacillus sp. LL6]
MTETTKSLKMTFLNSKNKKTSITLNNAAPGLEEAAVRDAMSIISQENIFSKEEVDLYKTPQSAQYIERTVTSVFDDTESNKD